MSVDINDQKEVRSSFFEKRLSPRWESKRLVCFEALNSQDQFDGLTKNISCTGVCITTHKKISKDDKLKIDLDLFQTDSVKLTGVVIWVKTYGIENQAGIKFYNTSQKSQDKILKYLLELNPEKFVNHWFEGW